MRALLHYDTSPGVRSLVESVDSAVVEIVQVPEHDDERFAREIAKADVLLHVLKPVTADIMDGAPNLRLVQKIGIGVDAIDLKHAEAKNIAVCNMPGTNTAAVAELAIGLMLACLRRIVPIATELHASNAWPARADHLDGAGEIGRRCIGLVGYGAVGRKIAGILRAFGAQVIAHDPMAEKTDVELVPLDDLLARADIVSLHVPLTADTKGLLGKERIAAMKRGAVVINTARGPLIDEHALAAALATGHLGAAGLDVLENEPPSDHHPLRGMSNVVATPHIAWLTDGTWQRSLDIITENCRRLAADKPLINRVG